MSRPFGIAGVQMAVVPWDAEATIDKIAGTTDQVRRNFPWVQLVLFHELAIPGLVQFVASEEKDVWKKNAQSIPGPITDRLS